MTSSNSSHQTLPFAAVFLDLDGTLIDSEPWSAQAWIEVFRERFGADISPFVQEVIGFSNKRATQHFLSRIGYEQDCEREDFVVEVGLVKESRFYDIARGSLQPFEGAFSLLDDLNRLGIPFVLASSGSHEKIAFGLAQTGLDRYFVVGSEPKPMIVSGADDVVHSKPAPDIFLLACERLFGDSSRIRECLVIEDALGGLYAAHAAGCGACLLVAQTRPRDELTHATSELSRSHVSFATCVVDTLSEVSSLDDIVNLFYGDQR